MSLLAYKNKHRGSIPKTEFPRVFKNVLDRLNIDNCASKNLIPGFKATGIYHLDENMVLCKIPILSRHLNESINSKDTG